MESRLTDLKGSDKMNLQTLYLMTTDGCNFHCSYCYEWAENYIKGEGNKVRYMNEEVIDRVIDLFFRSTKFNYRNNKILVNFFGGEPTLNPRAIDYACTQLEKIADEIGIVISKGIVTNGSLITDKIIQILSNHRVNVTVSIDGSEDIHNFQRKFINGAPSFKKVIQGATRLIEIKRMGKIPSVSAEVTVTSNTLDNSRLVDIYKDLLQIGFDSVHINPAYGKRNIGNFVEPKRYWESMADAHSIVLQSFLGDNPIASVEFYKFLKSVSTPDVKVCRAGDSLFAISPNGDIYACHALAGIDYFKIGNVSSVTSGDFEKMRLKLYTKNKIINSTCNSCQIVQECPKFCFANNYVAKGDLGEFPDNGCEYMRSIVHDIYSFLEGVNSSKSIKLKVEENISKTSLQV